MRRTIIKNELSNLYGIMARQSNTAYDENRQKNTFVMKYLL